MNIKNANRFNGNGRNIMIELEIKEYNDRMGMGGLWL